jgi:hypothetical protein
MLCPFVFDIVKKNLHFSRDESARREFKKVHLKYLFKVLLLAIGILSATSGFGWAQDNKQGVGG